MKKVEAIFRHIKLEEVKKALDKIDVRGITVTEAKGAGKQRGYTETYRGSQLIINLRPKVKLETVITDELVDRVVDTIMDIARTGAIGDGKIFVSPIEEAIAIRTGIRGDKAC
ncbi:MAG TPA: P-II family nitrogen regulator [Actinobacteria bacterium]|nr:P-II family nitrogen regulator [Actinomycetes bacterium]HEX21778.1 P-II family nitrogen regulator [Actinomycetota bacterium]